MLSFKIRSIRFISAFLEDQGEDELKGNETCSDLAIVVFSGDV